MNSVRVQTCPTQDAAHQGAQNDCLGAQGDGNGCVDIDDDLIKGLCEKPYKKIPFKLLYDSAGSQLFEKITSLKEYYPYQAEKDILNEFSDDIVDSIPDGAVIVELGAGDCSKTCLLLNSMIARRGEHAVRYIAIDVSREALRQAEACLRDLCDGLPEKNIHLVEAEYMQGLNEAQMKFGDAPLCVLWLGSSIGNFTRDESIEFLKVAFSRLNRNSMILLGSDVWKNEDVLYAAYNDSQGVTRDFICNGMMHVLRCCNHPLKNECAQSLWEYEPRVNRTLTQVEMWVKAKRRLVLLPAAWETEISCGEKLLVEISRKFRDDDLLSIIHASGLVVSSSWKSSMFRVQLLCSPQTALEQCWRDTDVLFSHIADWNAQPIDLRHPFLFYYGHLASFSKSRMSNEGETDLDMMFSRGIDPCVDTPEVCHPHPEVPDAWPSKGKVIEYVEHARQVMRKYLETSLDMHQLCMCLEHERMHQETLCYMLAQLRKEKASNGALCMKNSSSGFYFNHAVYQNALQACASTQEVVHVPANTVRLGVKRHQDGVFHWDNEYGTSTRHVEAFNMCSHPVTVGEYIVYLQDEKCNGLPATWSMNSSSQYSIHMPEATYRAEDVIDQPVYVSLKEAIAYAAWKHGRIMTEYEYASATEQMGISNYSTTTNWSNLECGGWEWTSSKFAPFPGFQPDPGYPEYSTDFFDGIHYTLKGSSPYTHSSMVRRSFRNFYQANYKYVFAKFRVVFDSD